MSEEVRTGSIGSYLWVEDWVADIQVADVLAALGQSVVGLWAVGISWDSGLLKPESVGQPGWSAVGPYALCRILSQAVLAEWPVSGCGWDEWYLFREPPQLRGRLHAFCNWGMSLREAAELRDVPHGSDLAVQLARYRPEYVVGDGQRTFLLATDPGSIAAFSALSERRRTTRCS